MHLGHQQIIRQTLTDARQHEAIALVMTFDRHPNTVVAPSRVPPLIYSLPQKLRAIESLGADTLLLIHFDKAFSEQTGEAFVRGLARDLGHIQSLCVGANFVFGHKRSGNVELLRKLGAELKFTVHGMAAVSLDGRAVSSTRIREAIRAGDLDARQPDAGPRLFAGGHGRSGRRTGPPARLPDRQPGRDRPGVAAARRVRGPRRSGRQDLPGGAEHRPPPDLAESESAVAGGGAPD